MEHLKRGKRRDTVDFYVGKIENRKTMVENQLFGSIYPINSVNFDLFKKLCLESVQLLALGAAAPVKSRPLAALDKGRAL